MKSRRRMPAARVGFRGVVAAASMAALAAAGAAGCNGSSDEGAPLPSPVTGAARTTSSIGPEQRSQLLDLGLIRKDDLGAAWEETTDKKSGFEVNSLEDIVAEESCKDLLEPFKILEGSETKTSPTFASADNVVSNTATLLDSAQSAGKLTSVLNSIDPNACLTTVYQKAVQRELTSIVDDGSSLSSLRVRRRELPGIGDSRSALEVTLDLTKGNSQSTLVFTRIAIQSGPIVQQYSIRSKGAPPDAENITKPSVQRVRNCITKGACT